MKIPITTSKLRNQLYRVRNAVREPFAVYQLSWREKPRASYPAWMDMLYIGLEKTTQFRLGITDIFHEVFLGTTS